MIFFSVGLPGRFAEWTDAVLVRLVERRLGSTKTVNVSGLEEVARAAIRTQALHLVACCRQPVPRLQAEILQAGRPFLVACGDPRTALQDLIERGQSLTEATRSAASGCAALLPLVTAPGALVLSAADAVDPATVIRVMADHFELGADDDTIAQSLADFAAAGLASRSGHNGTRQAQMGEREEAVVNGAVVPYFAKLLGGAELEPLVWERELFFISNDPPLEEKVPATRPVDLTGRPRILIYGPFISLPPGNWSADIVLAFSAETAGMGFLVEAYAGRQLARTRLESAGAQVIDVALGFTVAATLDHPIEVRVISERASFEGQLALGQVTLTPEKEIDSEVKDYLTRILQN
jgi:hypothetical protein